jgi:hypothetical protein
VILPASIHELLARHEKEKEKEKEKDPETEKETEEEKNETGDSARGGSKKGGDEVRGRRYGAAWLGYEGGLLRL